MAYVNPFLTHLHDVSKATSHEELSKLMVFAELVGASVSKLDNATSVEDVYHILKEHFETEHLVIPLFQSMLSVVGVNADKVSTLGSTEEELKAACQSQHPRFAFGKLIITLCDKLTKDLFGSLKSLLSDRLSGYHLDRVKTAESMFLILIRGEEVTPHKLGLLSSSFETLSLKDCVGLVEEFQRQMNTIHQDSENGVLKCVCVCVVSFVL